MTRIAICDDEKKHSTKKLYVKIIFKKYIK